MPHIKFTDRLFIFRRFSPADRENGRTPDIVAATYDSSGAAEVGPHSALLRIITLRLRMITHEPSILQNMLLKHNLFIEAWQSSQESEL